MNRITEQPLDLEALLRETANDASGALVVFSGTVRDHHEGKGVSGMRYTAYEPLAEKVLLELEQETIAKFPIHTCRIVHRVGNLAVGEDSVLIVVRSAHRGDGFDAARYAIDTLKERLPVWKQDFYTDGSESYQDGTPLPGSQAADNSEKG
ncbi:molybdopterin converting factor [Alkalilimnicola ehrlichii]|uniref:Molybdopterin synthase catalytic subunit n=1 Tax=Alkalilimnicola ehrlichii TaxID=351052 RepID=A0A3E0WYW4_9GAMM|nr:molybdenum cofactor biosynthesis protein MoaE [Alkalilimnicola ehrlichii]RFA30647.1 molybdopterin converting factor [Alkalilimnicola ehrlichii]RFA38226.1 molybdopterin converting factor [Alkalilimnicola ehrlichii]